MPPSHQRQNQRREAAYIPLAKWFLTAQTLEAKANKDASSAKKMCASAMNAVNVSSFSIRVEDKQFSVKLERPFAERVNIRKLYTLLLGNEITLDEFFDCIVAPVTAVEETIGRELLNRVKESYKKSLDLTIEEIHD